MFKNYLPQLRKNTRRLLYPMLSVTVVCGILLSSISATQAISIPELIFRGIQVIQLSTISDRQEVNIGKQINDQMVGREFRLHRNRDLTMYVNQIGQRLAQTSDRPNIPYTFQVVDDSRINAFATMGGFVYIHTGLINAADNEAQLASVIAHEIGHIVGRHAIQQMREMAIAQGVASAAGLDTNRAVQIGVELALRRPNSRSAEFEADELGIINLGRAGYAQEAALDFMAKLLSSSSPPTFLSTHPATRDRIEAMRRHIDPQLAGQNGGMNNERYRQIVTQLLS
ncbi:MAG: M48 family metallopeptidase [Limnospira sp. PMC 894.15]|uniref:M48 family metallopeptidase n=1 Tax=Limnospira TaxID=2596745 RepID=UPI00061AA1BF|nr:MULTISPECIES: M48 family metallopeptidase [Limnospira]MDT9189019.1 M48 family metallopeptidase [Limnospira sp. PMC 894.15]MDT9234922.1 M48 family metallopeptidase [Limnospira sp. PMC 917.15]QNH56809.1 MAG: M48 family metalloprotease [Limnospira indica BM01]